MSQQSQQQQLHNKHFLELRIPPLIVTALCIISLFIIQYLTNYSFTLSKDTFSLSTKILLFILFLFIGGIVSLLGVWEFNKLKTTVNPMKPNETSNLVDTGIYSVTRNPMYIGFLCFLIGFCFLLMDLFGFCVIVPFFIWYITVFQIIPEERMLINIFGNKYVEYQKRVSRWILL
ncbi:hypothetical protein ABK040_003150 [Willaertia magna]